MSIGIGLTKGTGAACKGGPFTINASAGHDGSISPSGLVVVQCGEDQAFAITPGGGYVVNDVEVDLESVGAVTEYTFLNVQANHSIRAIFVEQEPAEP